MSDKGMLNDLYRDMMSSNEPGIHVISADPNGTSPDSPPTEVHVLMNSPVHRTIAVMRLKSARAVDDLIAALTEHRAFVFGAPAPDVVDFGDPPPMTEAEAEQENLAALVEDFITTSNRLQDIMADMDTAGLIGDKSRWEEVRYDIGDLRYPFEPDTDGPTPEDLS